MPKLEWENLLSNTCPKCGYELNVIENDYRICQNNSCSFTITKWKYNEMIDNFDRDERRKGMNGYGME